jgi:hypothetical protein
VLAYVKHGTRTIPFLGGEAMSATNQQGSGFGRTARYKSMRCPYCVEGREFKLMTVRGSEDWQMCSNCGHLAMSNNPDFKCPCAKCSGSRFSIGRKPN